MPGEKRFEMPIGSVAGALRSMQPRELARAAGAVVMALVALALLLAVAFRPSPDPLVRATIGALAGLLAAGSWLMWPRDEHAFEPPLPADIPDQRMAAALRERSRKAAEPPLT